MITTYNQAKRLKELGYDRPTEYFYQNESFLDSTLCLNWNDKASGSNVYSAPTISEALQDIRDRFNMACCVFYMTETVAHGYNKTVYYFKYGLEGKSTLYNSYNVDYKSYDTHPLCESALLDELLTYLESRR